MAAVFYRVKTPQGPWIRANGVTPFDITGLTNGTVYEIEDGSGTLIERTPEAPAVFEAAYVGRADYEQTANATSHTLPAVDLGAADPDRVMFFILAVGISVSTRRIISNLVIGGVTITPAMVVDDIEGTLVSGAGDSELQLYLLKVPMPTGTTAVATMNTNAGSQARFNLIAIRTLGADLVASAKVASTLAVSGSVLSSSLAVVDGQYLGLYMRSRSSAVDADGFDTVVGVTERTDDKVGSDYNNSGDHHAFYGDHSVIADETRTASVSSNVTSSHQRIAFSLGAPA